MGAETRVRNIPILFNISLDGAVKELNGRIMGRDGMLEADKVKYSWEINQLLLTHDVAVVADSTYYLLPEFGKVCERRKLNTNAGKIKVMRCSTSE